MGFVGLRKKELVKARRETSLRVGLFVVRGGIEKK